MSQENTLSPEFQKVMGLLNACKEEVSKRVVGQGDVVEGILVSLLVGGHTLLEGVPGLAKTLLVKTISDISGLSFKRIQFTPTFCLPTLREPWCISREQAVFPCGRALSLPIWC